MKAMALHAVLVVLISCVSLSACLSCGSVNNCSKEYDADCPSDHSCDFYDNCGPKSSSCSGPLGATPSPTVKCFDTCITGVNPLPLQCCADSISMPGTVSVTTGPQYQIARLHASNKPDYRLNTYCKYNIQCPSEDFNLYYTMVRFSVEPPDNNSKCLDFMRYQFTVTGKPVPLDLCGNIRDLSTVQKFGVHSSGLTLDFRSNRINTGEGFFLALTCTRPPAAGGSRRKRQYNGWWYDDIFAEPTCTPSQTLTAIVGRDQDEPLKTADEYFEEIFPKAARVRYDLTITKGSVVKYNRNDVFVERDGRTLNRFRNIRMMQAFNRIEGHLMWRNSIASNRTLPGYGFMRIGRDRVCRYIQTLIDPRYLLNDEEEQIVHDLYEELYIREKLNKGVRSRNKLNCDINRLAELNKDSCSDAVRAVANFFLENDTFKDDCDDRPDPTPRRWDPTPRRRDPTPRRRDPTPRRRDPAPTRW